MDFDSQLNRRRLLQAGAGLSLAGLLAACGGDDDDGGDTAAAPASSEAAPASSAAAPESSAAAPESSAAGGESSAAPESSAAEGGVVTQGTHASSRLRPADEEGSLEVFDWQGYEDTAGCPDSCYGFWDLYERRPTASRTRSSSRSSRTTSRRWPRWRPASRPTSSTPASRTPRTWYEAGLIQPWDASYITGFDTIAARAVPGRRDRRRDLRDPVGLGLLVARLPRRQGAARGGELEPHPRRALQGSHRRSSRDGVAIIKVGGLINGVARPQRDDAGRDRGRQGDDDPGEAEHPHLLDDRRPTPSRRSSPATSTSRTAGRTRYFTIRAGLGEEADHPVHAAQGGPPGLGLRATCWPRTRRGRRSRTR